MPPFRFRLEQVKLYRKQLEEQAMLALSKAVAHRDALKERIATLQKDIAEQHASLSRAASLGAAELWLTRHYVGDLKKDLESARLALKEAENTVEKRRAELVEKAKDHGLLATLKEKQAARHLQLERQNEQRTNDETATLRYKPAAI